VITLSGLHELHADIELYRPKFNIYAYSRSNQQDSCGDSCRGFFFILTKENVFILRKTPQNRIKIYKTKHKHQQFVLTNT